MTDDYFLCEHCGAELPVSANFCRFCGASEDSGWESDRQDDYDEESEDDFDYDEFVEREFPEHADGNRGVKPLNWVVVVAVILLFSLLFPYLLALL